MFELPALLFYYLSQKKQAFSDRKQLETWQEKKVRKHLQWVQEHAPFYRELWNGKSLDEWKEFPIIEKRDMMEHFDTLNTVSILKEEAFSIALQGENSRNFSPTLHSITVGLSSGTSGNRGIFLVSPKERIKWAATVLQKTLPSSLLTSQRIAFFLRANSNLYSSVQKGPIQFSFYDLLEDIDRHVLSLNQYQPTILIGPPSLLRLLAKKQERGLLNLSPIKIISVAEVLDPIDETYLVSVFKQQIHQVYQCTEGFLATTCEHGTLHLNEDLVVIQKEYIDKKLGKFLPIITDFSRTTQPIIRYRLNDILTEKQERCLCGSPFAALSSIDGRQDDLFYLKKTNGTTFPVFPDFIRRCILFSSHEITEYRIIQHNSFHLEIMFETSSSKREDIELGIRKQFDIFFKDQNIQSPFYSFSLYTSPPKGVKLRRIERRFSTDGD